MAGPETAAVTKALTVNGEKMSTLDVDERELATAVSRYSTVVSIQTETDFPHGLAVHVVSRPPVMNATDGDRSVPVAADGTLLPAVDTAGADIPNVDVADLPGSGKLAGDSLEVATVAGAAPAPLLPLIEGITVEGESGMEITLKGDIPVIFGDSGQATEKWAAVSAVLANPKVKTLTHLDVRVPERPSIGGAAPPLEGG
jgi:cell division septal protein FtsQ